VEDIVQFNHGFVQVGRLTLPSLAKPDEGKVVQLSPEGRERRMVEVEWKDLGLFGFVRVKISYITEKTS